MKIGVVVVTYNRLECLKKTLKYYDVNTKKPEYLLVINNSSTDGTEEYLDEWKEQKCDYEKIIVTMPHNTGGSGGFYAGFEHSLTLDADWIWVADDDAYPDRMALENLEKYFDNLSLNEQDDIAALCSAVINHEKIDTEHRKRSKLGIFKFTTEKIPEKNYERDSFELDEFSYVGTCIRKSVLKKCGITDKSFFIYWDDTEHSLRVRKEGKIVCVTKCKVVHDTGVNRSGVIDWRGYYMRRNELIMVKRHLPKRYFYTMYLLRYFRQVSIFSKNSLAIKIMMRDALQDAKADRTGLHTIYKPGWKAK